jgi:heme exporter protein CcmD
MKYAFFILSSYAVVALVFAGLIVYGITKYYNLKRELQK